MADRRLSPLFDFHPECLRRRRRRRKRHPDYKLHNRRRFVGAIPVPSTTAVTTWHNDGLRTGAYPVETTLTAANVNTASFGKLFFHQTNGQIEAEPLYVPNLKIPGKGAHNVVFVATLNDYVYAFDADSSAGANANPLWTANLGPAAPAGTGGGGDSFEQGIASTPAIDPARQIIYVVTKNGIGTAASFKLHALSLLNGTEQFGGPVTVTASVSGVKGGVNGAVLLNSEKQYQRSALLLLNGVVYFAMGGLVGDTPPCRGWVFGYNATSLKQVGVFTTAPNAGRGSQNAFAGGGIWMSGGGISTDGTCIYAATGNGAFSASTGGIDYGDSVIKLYPGPSGLSVYDYFTPFDEAAYDKNDLDLGTSAPMLVPGTSVLVQPCKAGVIYVLNRNQMGKFNASTDQVVQELNLNGGNPLRVPQSTGSDTTGSTTSDTTGSSTTGSTGSTGSSGSSSSTGSIGSGSGSGGSGSGVTIGPFGFWGSTAYYNGNVYFTTEKGPLFGYRFSSGRLASGPFGTSVETFIHATPSVSFDGYLKDPAPTAIAWAIQDSSTAVLCAYSATTMQELYKAGARDQAGPYIKFGVPAIANGKVYVPCQDGVYVYGELGAGPRIRPKPVPSVVGR